MPAPRFALRTSLTVEDDDDTRAAIHQHLVDLGFRSLVAATGSEALRIIESNQYIDLLISDFVVPGANGRSIIKVAEYYRPEIKVIVMSGQARSQLPAELQGRLIEKPFDGEALDERLIQLFGHEEITG